MTTIIKNKKNSGASSFGIKKENFKLVEAMLLQIESEKTFWTRNWSGEAFNERCPANALTGRKYRGENPLRVFVFTYMNGYESNRMLTFNQAFKELGLKFKNNTSHSACSIYTPCITAPKDRDEENEENEEKRRIFFRTLNIFSIDQFEITDEQWEKIKKNVLVDYEAQASKNNKLAEKLIKRCGVKITTYDGAQPCYLPKEDRVELPLDKNFETNTDKYSVLFHELSHWTKNITRTNRERLGLSYPEEELVAELSSFMVCLALGLHYSPSLEGQKYAYLKSWLEPLGSDHERRMKALGLALEEAQKASSYLLKFIKTELDEDSNKNAESRLETA